MKKFLVLILLMVSVMSGVALVDASTAAPDDSKQLLADINASLTCLQKEGMAAYVKKWIPKAQQEGFLKSYHKTISPSNPEEKVLKSFQTMIETFKGGNFSFSENHGANFAQVATKQYKPHAFIKDEGTWKMIR